MGAPIYDLPHLLQLAQPMDEHQNNKKLFFLARGIKALEAQGTPLGRRKTQGTGLPPVVHR